MTQKVAIITDSIACLPPEMVRQYQLHILPINLYFGDKVYRDGVDITPTEAYELFLKDPKFFKTSAPPPTDCLEAYRKASKQAKNILCVTVSSKLSMTYESSLLAKEAAKTELPGVTIGVELPYCYRCRGFCRLSRSSGSRRGEEPGRGNESHRGNA